MASEPVRIAMWSGPRNISTAMMRSFGSRPDTVVIDEPFYAIYLLATGIDHPMREESIASQSHDWREVVKNLLGDLPEGKTIYYQKHITHHMVPEIGMDWIKRCRNVFLIRHPKKVIASYIKKRKNVTLDDIGLQRQWEIFQQVSDFFGEAPPVIDSDDILANPESSLSVLCRAIDIPFTKSMLSWPAGKRDTDGVWAPVWYDNVEKSTGFGLPNSGVTAELPSEVDDLADKAAHLYDLLAKCKLTTVHKN